MCGVGRDAKRGICRRRGFRALRTFCVAEQAVSRMVGCAARGMQGERKAALHRDRVFCVADRQAARRMRSPGGCGTEAARREELCRACSPDRERMMDMMRMRLARRSELLTPLALLIPALAGREWEATALAAACGLGRLCTLCGAESFAGRAARIGKG